MSILKKVKKVKKQTNNVFDYSIVEGLTEIELDTRKFIQFDFDFTTPGQLVGLPHIDFKELEDAIVKVTININLEDMHKINIKELELNILEYCFLLKPIVASIKRTKRVKNKNLTTDLTPIDAVKVWLKNNKHVDSVELLKLAKQIIEDVVI